VYTKGCFLAVQFNAGQKPVMAFGIVRKEDMHQDEKLIYRFHLTGEAFPGRPGNANSMPRPQV